MKKLILSSVALCAMVSVAAAADLAARPYTKTPAYVAPVYNWTGFYIGGNVGAVWLQNDWYDTFEQQPISKDKKTGFVGGFQVGYDWQLAPSWVVGVRGMFDWSDVHTDVGQNVSCTNCGLVDHSKLKSFQTLTGRLGYLAQPNLLIYAKGGAAWEQSRYSQTEPAPFSYFVQQSSARTGYDVGGGLEWMFAPGWSTFVEYDYANFRTFHSSTFETNISPDMHMVLFGVSYRFGNPIVAKY